MLHFYTLWWHLPHSLRNILKDLDLLLTASSLLPPQGSFDQEVCQSLHSINPYGSRESRIIFSTWNLDHRLDTWAESKSISLSQRANQAQLHAGIFKNIQDFLTPFPPVNMRSVPVQFSVAKIWISWKTKVTPIDLFHSRQFDNLCWSCFLSFLCMF